MQLAMFYMTIEERYIVTAALQRLALVVKESLHSTPTGQGPECTNITTVDFKWPPRSSTDPCDGSVPAFGLSQSQPQVESLFMFALGDKIGSERKIFVSDFAFEYVQNRAKELANLSLDEAMDEAQTSQLEHMRTAAAYLLKPGRWDGHPLLAFKAVKRPLGNDEG